jgi:hypothetical protein
MVSRCYLLFLSVPDRHGSVSTRQIHTLLVEMKTSTLDVRWTYFQAPLQIEDALGVKFPVPSEYDFRMLQIIIKGRYLEGPIA